MASIEADTLDGARRLHTDIVTGTRGRRAIERAGWPAFAPVCRKGALEHPRPRPNYAVTTPARAGAALKRMPPATFRRFLASRA